MLGYNDYDRLYRWSFRVRDGKKALNDGGSGYQGGFNVKGKATFMHVSRKITSGGEACFCFKLLQHV